MDLMCAEKITEDSCHATKDHNVFEDERVLQELLNMEHLYVPHCDYFNNVQTDVEPYMRKLVTQWMLEVCDSLNCEDQVFPLAVNMLDRYLCTSDTPKNYLQRVAANCILMASKIRQAVTISIDTLCKYTCNTVTACEMRAQELILVEKLKWDLLAITGFDFVDHILQRIRWNRHGDIIRRHSIILIHLCYTEYEFMRMKPSIIATVCIISAIMGLKIKIDYKIFRHICALTNSPIEQIKNAVNQLELLVAKEESVTSNNVKSTTSINCSSNMDKIIPNNADEEQLELTPTDVQEIEF